MQLQKKLMILSVFILLSFSTAQINQSNSIYANGARTIHEAVDLNSPESAVQTFISAWNNRDYPLVYILLDPITQDYILSRALRYDMEALIPSDKKFDDIRYYDMLRKDLGINPYSDASFLFDFFLLYIEQYNLLPFTTIENATITDLKIAENQAMLTINYNNDAQTITFYLKQEPFKKQWKISYIEIPNYHSQSDLWGNKKHN